MRFISTNRMSEDLTLVTSNRNNWKVYDAIQMVVLYEVYNIINPPSKMTQFLCDMIHTVQARVEATPDVGDHG